MKKLALLGGAVFLAASNVATAQNLSWYGMNTCFTGMVWVQTGGAFSNSSCPQGSGNTQRLSWGFSSGDRSAYEFTRVSPPQGPGDQGSGDPASLNFGGVGSSIIFNLGLFRYENEAITGVSNTTILDYAFLSLDFFFDGSLTTPAFSYTNQLKLNNDESDGGTDQVTVENGGAQTFDFNGYSYSFQIAGMDDSDSGTCNGSNDVDGLPRTMSAYAGSYTQNEVCGKLTYLGPVSASTVPEPSTYALMATSLIGLAGFARRRKA